MTKQRIRRTPEQMIEDLQKEIERVKTRAAQAKVKKDPALKHVSAAVRAIDKAAGQTEDSATRKALAEARVNLVAAFELAGVAPDKGTLIPQRAAPVEPKDVLAYIAKHPGSSGESIAKAVGTDTKTLRPVVKKLVVARQVKTSGKARGTRYSAV